MNLTNARRMIADTLTGAGLGVTVRPSIPRGPWISRDGWVRITELGEAGFARMKASLSVVVLLGADARRAEELIDEIAAPLFLELTTADMGDLAVFDVKLTPMVVLVGEDNKSMYALDITCSTEVE